MGHWKGEDRREQLVREVLAEFSFLHPEMDVQFEFAKDILPKKTQREAAGFIAEMIRSGKIIWDVVWLDPLIYYHVALELDDWHWGEIHLVDFADVPGFAETQKSFLVDVPDAHKYTAAVFPGPYIEGFFYAVWYNQNVADRLGIHVAEDGMTYEDLLGYVEAVHAYNQTAAVPVSAFLEFEHAAASTRLFYSLLLSHFPDGLVTADSIADKDAAVDHTTDLFAELGRYEPLAAGATTQSWHAAASAMMDDQALFFFDATWRYNAWNQFDPEGLKKLRLAQMPGIGPKNHVIGGYISTWAVLKNAPGRDAGIKLLQYWSQPSIAEKWVRYTKSPTGLGGNLYDPVYGRDIYAEYQRRVCAQYTRVVMDPLMVGKEFNDVGVTIEDKRLAEIKELLRGGAVERIPDEYGMDEAHFPPGEARAPSQ